MGWWFDTCYVHRTFTARFARIFFLIDDIRVLDTLALCHVCALLSKLVLAARAISGFVDKKRKIVSFFPLAIVLDLLAHMVTSLHLIVNLSLYSSFGNVCLNRK